MKHYFARLVAFIVLFGVPGALSGSVLLPEIAQAQSTVEQANALLNQTGTLLQNDQPEAALDAGQQALEIYQQIGDRLGVAQALGNIGLSYLTLGQGDQALAAMQESLAIAQQEQDPVTEFNAWWMLALLHIAQEDYSSAAEYIESAISIAETFDNLELLDYAREMLAYVQEGQARQQYLEETNQTGWNVDSFNDILANDNSENTYQ